MMLFDLPANPAVPVVGDDRAFPIRRIFCVGQNYAAHAREMGAMADRSAPFYFTKSAWAYAPSGATLPYPPGTGEYHYEVECVVAIAAPVFRAAQDKAMEAVFGYGVGLDMTRRDLQAVAKGKGRPWDLAKDAEHSAVLGALTPKEAAGDINVKTITLTQNGKEQQRAKLSDMVHDIPAIIADLSRYYHLEPGDLIMTGTPAGVGPVAPEDVLEGMIEGLAPLRVAFAAAQ